MLFCNVMIHVFVVVVVLFVKDGVVARVRHITASDISGRNSIEVLLSVDFSEWCVFICWS